MGQNNNTSIAPLCTKIWFDFSKGVVNYRDGRSLYRTKLDGSTSILIEGMEFPVSGCPIPDRLALANFQHFLFRYRKVWPLLIASIVLSVLFQWLLWLLPDSHLTEMKWNFVALFSFWMNTALIVSFSLCFIAFVVWKFFDGSITFKVPELMPAPDLLEAGFSLGKDVFVYTEENETREQFAARAFEAQKNIKDGVFVVVIPFRNSGGVVIKKGENEKTNPFDSSPFLREKPPYQNDDFSGEIEKRGFRFSEESFGEYRNYLSRFQYYFQEYAKTEKIKLKMEGHLEQILEF
jgi:hypothetical protein